MSLTETGFRYDCEGWDLHDRYALSTDTLDRCRPLWLAACQITPAEAGQIWPRPNPPNYNYETGGFYPHHLLHHKFIRWAGPAHPRPLQAAAATLTSPESQRTTPKPNSASTAPTVDTSALAPTLTTTEKPSGAFGASGRSLSAALSVASLSVTSATLHLGSATASDVTIEDAAVSASGAPLTPLTVANAAVSTANAAVSTANAAVLTPSAASLASSLASSEADVDESFGPEWRRTSIIWFLGFCDPGNQEQFFSWVASNKFSDHSNFGVVYGDGLGYSPVMRVFSFFQFLAFDGFRELTPWTVAGLALLRDSAHSLGAQEPGILSLVASYVGEPDDLVERFFLCALPEQRQRLVAAYLRSISPKDPQGKVVPRGPTALLYNTARSGTEPLRHPRHNHRARRTPTARKDTT